MSEILEASILSVILKNYLTINFPLNVSITKKVYLKQVSSETLLKSTNKKEKMSKTFQEIVFNVLNYYIIHSNFKIGS